VQKDDISFTDQGSAFVFFRSGTSWSQQAVLTPPNPAVNDNYANAVSIYGDYIVVGCAARDTTISATLYSDIGAVYIYLRSGANWNLQQKLSSCCIVGSSVGLNVCIYNDWLLVEQFGGGLAPNTCFFYKRAGTVWSAYTGLQTNGAVNAGYTENYGCSIAFNSNVALVTAPYKDVDINSRAGTCYLYAFNSFTYPFQRRIDDNTPQFWGNFGFSCAIDGYNIIFGAPLKNGNKGEIQFLNIE